VASDSLLRFVGGDEGDHRTGSADRFTVRPPGRESIGGFYGSRRCNVREVSEWAGHNNVAFTPTRYGGLFEAVDRPDALLGGTDPASAEVVKLRRTEES
jgi:hypothetical protein